MAKTFTEAGDVVAAIGRRLIDTLATHKDLRDCEVTIGYLFAHSDTEAAALTHGGYPAAAVVNINPLKNRVEGLPDATITIDATTWHGMNEQEKAALIDHELCHLVVAREKAGEDGELGAVKSDDIGRPKLKIRKHDFQLGGFYEVVERHQTAAVEAVAVMDVHTKFKQGILAFG